MMTCTNTGFKSLLMPEKYALKEFAFNMLV